MLSAIAARKAALAAQQLPQAQESSAPAAPTPSGASGSSQSSRGNVKRKSSTQSTKKVKKKPRSTRRVEIQNVVDSFQNQDDLIILDDSDEHSDASMGVFQDSDQQVRTFSSTQQKKAWSPSLPVEDSSDESGEDDGLPENIPDLSSLFTMPRSKADEPPEETTLSTFEPVVDQNLFHLTEEECVAIGSSLKCIVVALNAQDSLCLLGVCRLRVLRGAITVLGTTLIPSARWHDIYAPSSSPLPVVRVVASTAEPPILPPRLSKLSDFRALFALEELHTGIQGLGRACRPFQNVFEPYNGVGHTPLLSGLSMVIRQSKDVHQYFLPSSWSTSLQGLDMSSSYLRPPVYVVKGPKKCGKSTFARTLTNRLLEAYQRVAFLECDIGQSEFTPGGMVSLNVISVPLLGPPFTHPTLPNHAHYIGSSTPRSSPSHYLDSIFALVQTYRLDIQTPSDMAGDPHDLRMADVIPLVVNTMGWAKGLGADLTQKIEDFVNPTEVFDIQPPVEEHHSFSAPARQRSQYDAYQSDTMGAGGTAKIHTLQPMASYSSAAGYPPADQRAIAIMSYFHAQFPPDPPTGELNQITARSWDTSRPLLATPPYEIDCSIAFDKVILTGAGSEDVVKEEVARVLNGALVGFVSCETGTVDLGDPSAFLSSFGIPYTRHQNPPSPSTSTCVGLGFIRGVSSCAVEPYPITEVPQKMHIHLLTPVPLRLLSTARVLVKGELEIPIWGMLDFGDVEDPDEIAGVEVDKVPYLQWSKVPDGALGAQKRRVRRNLMRRGQL